MEPHPIERVPDVVDNVAFVNADTFSEMERPWPRCQDLPEKTFKKPDKDDLVVAVSHCWPYSAHPDPLSQKADPLEELLGEANRVHNPQNKTVVFFDFLSVSQRPWALGQTDRTKEQEVAFGKALRAFPQIYLQADAVIHLDGAQDQMPGDCAPYYADILALDGAEFRMQGEWLRVVKMDATMKETGTISLFDAIESVGAIPIKSLEDFQRARDSAKTAEMVKPSFMSRISASFNCCQQESVSLVKMRRCPFGAYSRLSASQKGWVYLERFASMVKGAMVHEDQMETVAFATTEDCLTEIWDGAKRLRAAAKLGRAKLIESLQYFVDELEKKHFTAVSLDKANNTGGVGGVAKSDAKSDAKTIRDADIVGGLMRELVDHLAENWEKEQFAQRQRQLFLAVNRGDIVAASQLLEEGTDPNHQDSQGLTCMHCCAKNRDVKMCELLIRWKGDLTKQDNKGNAPAHMVVLFMQPETISTFETMATSMEVLSIRNKAGVSVFRRFSIWAKTAQESKPYPPGMELIEKLTKKFPQLEQNAGKFRAAPLKSKGPYKEETMEIDVKGQKSKVFVFKPTKCKDTRDILWLGHAVFMCSEIQLEAVRIVASNICDHFKARIFVCSDEAIDMAVRTYDEAHANIEAVVKALPLRSKYVFIDNAIGMGLSMLWAEQERLAGAMVLNPMGWFSDDFFGSEAHTTMVNTFDSHSVRWREKDIKLCQSMSSGCCFAEGPEELQKAQDAMGRALPRAREKFFERAANTVWFNCNTGTPKWNRLGKLSAKIPMTVACGSHAPAALVQESAVRIQERVEGSELKYISESKQWWEMEGEDQQREVANMVHELCRQAKWS